jgi:hypothetical protein
MAKVNLILIIAVIVLILLNVWAFSLCKKAQIKYRDLYYSDYRVIVNNENKAWEEYYKASKSAEYWFDQFKKIKAKYHEEITIEELSREELKEEEEKEDE